MNKDPLNKGVSTGNTSGPGPATREMVQARARELAVIAGRALPDVLQGDYEQAKRELAVESSEERQEEMPGSIPSISPVPDSTGGQVPESPSEDEDGEGRSESEQLVEEGAKEAELDQIRQAARAVERSDGRGS